MNLYSAGYLQYYTLHTKLYVHNYLAREPSIKHQWHVSMHTYVVMRVLYAILQVNILIKISYALYKELTLASTIPHVYNEYVNYTYVNAVL